MSWAEVKKINSDMTTPLDRLFKNSFYLYASDNTLAAITGDFAANHGSIKVNYDGACRVKLSLVNTSSTTGETATYSVKVNGIDKAHITKLLTGGSSGEAYVDISINKNDIITCERYDVHNVVENAFYVCGTIGIGGLGAEAIVNNT